MQIRNFATMRSVTGRSAPSSGNLPASTEKARLLDIEQKGSGLEDAEEINNDTTDLSKTQKPDKKYSFLAVVGIFTVFMLSGPMLIMSNKYILKDIDFSFPLTLSFMTLTFSSVSCWVYVKMNGIQMERSKTMTRSFYIRRIIPIGALSTGTVVFGMTSYLYLTVAFVQMLKAFTPVMTLLGLVIFRLESPTRKAIVCVLIICSGTAIAGYGELNFSIVGVMCMICAQMFEAMKLVFTQVVLQKNRFSLVETLYYVTPMSAACVFFFACILEFPRMGQDDVNKILSNTQPFMLSCVVAITTNVVNTFVVQNSNALILKLAVTARNALLVFFNAALMGETVTILEAYGYAVSLSGFMAYNYVKFQEKR
jgi:drug/metabolite transporter (DMT)-like permease